MQMNPSCAIKVSHHFQPSTETNRSLKAKQRLNNTLITTHTTV